MPITIKVNGTANSLVHKMSNGVSVATIPDVCKTPTPGGPVPMPYPNVAQSITLSNGTTTVKGDKMMAANKGSKFALSNGDNAGVAGGVKSNGFMKEATWILYSFDVKVDGKNASRFTDKMFHNAENTANISGEAQIIVTVSGADEDALRQLAKDCNEAVNKAKGPVTKKKCAALGTAKHKCCEDSIKASGQNTLGAEKAFNRNGTPSSKNRAAAIGKAAAAKAAAKAANPRLGKKALAKAFLKVFFKHTPPISLDAVIYKSAPPSFRKDNIKAIFDFKFPCGPKGKKGKMSAKQRRKYNGAMKPLKVQIIDVLSVI